MTKPDCGAPPPPPPNGAHQAGIPSFPGLTGLSGGNIDALQLQYDLQLNTKLNPFLTPQLHFLDSFTCQVKKSLKEEFDKGKEKHLKQTKRPMSREMEEGKNNNFKVTLSGGQGKKSV